MEPPQPPQGSLRDPTQGETPLRKSEMCTDDGNRQEWCKRGHNAPGANKETDANKRRTARSGHSQRASAKPTAEAYKATTKKERGKEWVSDSDRASQRGTNARKSDRHRKRKDQKEREELSLTRSLREGTASTPAAPGCQENQPAEAEATPKGEGSKPKRQTADRGQSRLG